TKNLRLLNGLIYIPLAAVFLIAASGICVRPPADIPPLWLLLSWLLSFLMIFLPLKLKLLGNQQAHALTWVLAVTLLLVVLNQLTGGDRSPLVFTFFLLMGVAAWEGKSFYPFLIAAIICLS